MSRNAVVTSLAESHRPSGSQAAKRYKQYVAFVNERQGTDLRAPIQDSEESHDDCIEVLTTLHRDASEPWDWNQIASSPPPPPRRENEAAAQRTLDAYKPTFLDRLLGRAEGHRQALAAAVAKGRTADEAAWQQVCEQWNWCQLVARKVLQHEIEAYTVAIDNFGPFEELLHLGVQVETRIADPSFVEAFMRFRHNAVPWTEYKQLASGRTSVKEMPNTKHRELTQEHVCSAAVRIAREVFSLLPVQRTFVHASTVLLDPANGHSDTVTMLSVEFDRQRLVRSNFDRVQPVSAVESYRHAMQFKKSVGLLPVQPLEPLAQLTSLE